MPLQEHLSFWNDIAVRVLDVRREILLPGSQLQRLPENMLFFAWSGYGSLLIDGTTYSLSPFSVRHAGKDAAISMEAITEPIEYTVIYYRAELMPSAGGELAAVEEALLQMPFGIQPSKRLSLHQVVEQLELKWGMRQGIEGFHANALLQGLLYELLKQLLAEGYQTPSEAVAIVMKHIDANYNKPLKLDVLAGLVHCSSRQLQRWFNGQKQLGPMEYVIKVRMSHAAELLRHTDATIQEIALSIGYRDLYYFSRAFKNYYGIAPQDFRRTSLAGEVYALAASQTIDDAAVIKHRKGELRLQRLPKRIAVLDVQYADQLFTLKEQPAGSVGIGGAEISCFPDYLQNKLGQFTVLGTCERIDMHALAELQPDLIVCTDLHERLYPKLCQFAPTLLFDRNEDWRKILGIFGVITGKKQEAERILMAYREKTEKLSDMLADKLRGQHVAIIRPRETSIRLHTASHRTGAVLYADLRLPAPFYITGESVSDTAYHISIEDLPGVNANHYFLLSNDMFKEQVLSMQRSIEWNSLHAVKQQCVYTVDASTWIGSYGPTGINRIVDEVAQSLLGA
ncbi:iron complex transport system substrate-binding protein [Paenibacillus sp. BK033]|uniref:helix-turn-helix domain-containing protein n=1 Tax=Paenibacillus sp. BK033 TaxID=2512133 RepID=UPI001053515C|nr:helix-turn-helix domain-containing protein [Paenibacillus sp. BK033]TCN01076.1 iron complex transport system substrate-binding protein [Paenibacillus sp. BK033]